jgi:hypothetical protein
MGRPFCRKRYQLCHSHHSALGLLLFQGKQSLTLLNVWQAMCDSYATILNDYVTRTILQKFGFEDIAQFRAEQQQLNRDFIFMITERIDQANLADTEFLVYGFDAERKSTHQFHVQHPGRASSLDRLLCDWQRLQRLPQRR